MSTQNILKGAMVLALASVTSKIIGMLYKIPITNIIGDQGNAIYASAYNMYVLLITFSAIGMPSAISKLVSERYSVGAYREAYRVYKIALCYATMLSFLLASILWFGAETIADTMKNPDLMMPLRALAPTSVIVTIMAVSRGYFQGMGRMGPTAISQVIEQIFNAIASVLLAYYFISEGVVEAATGSTLGTGIGAVAGLLILVVIALRSKVKTTNKEENLDELAEKFIGESSGSVLKGILITVIPIVISTSIFAIITNIDTLMLNTYLPNLVDEIVYNEQYYLLPVTDSDTMDTLDIVNSLAGQYLGKYLTLINVPVALILTIAMAATPSISGSMAKNDLDDVREKSKMIIKLGFLFAAPSAVGLTLFAYPIMNLLYRQIPDGGELLIWGSISILFIATAQLTTGILQGMGKQSIPTKHAFIACIIKVLCNFVFLQYAQINIYSVVHSTTICYLIYAILNTRYIKNEIELELNWHLLAIKPIIAAMGMGVISFSVYCILNWIIPFSGLWLIISVSLAVVLYAIIGILIGAITKNDIENIPGGHKILKLLK
ncbi:MAG: hypothetical protein ATN36_09030 [Epulopiscium sp. Nele67-Bin005]|nr:MAG: hypothetical protein ATN36_09030 [Epulopiscium sp. Nele67-Bin005]